VSKGQLTNTLNNLESDGEPALKHRRNTCKTKFPRYGERVRSFPGRLFFVFPVTTQLPLLTLYFYLNPAYGPRVPQREQKMKKNQAI